MMAFITISNKSLQVLMLDEIVQFERRAEIVAQSFTSLQTEKSNLRRPTTTTSSYARKPSQATNGHLKGNLLYDRQFDADRVWTMLIQEGSALLSNPDNNQHPLIGTIAMEVGMHRPKQCLEAARAGFQAHCVEPSPASFQRVQKGVKKESLEIRNRVHLYPMAAGGTTGDKVPFTAMGGTGDHVGNVDAWNMKTPEESNIKEQVTYAVGSILEVPTIRLDDIIQKQHQGEQQTSASTVFALKVDTQGFELAVFAGLSESIRNLEVSFILLEYWPRGMDLLSGTPDACVATKVLEQLIQAGYTLYAMPVVAHPRAPKGYQVAVQDRPLHDIKANCQWYIDLERQFPSEEYKMGYWSDVLAVAPNAPSFKGHALTKLGKALE